METGRHGHIWLLADGTPAHAPPGKLVRNDDGDVACHLCGRWFTHLGAHLRRHGWTAEQYRDAVGLAKNRALCNESLSGRIADRQSARWWDDDDLRHQFEDGREQAARMQAAGGPPRVPALETAQAAAAQLQSIRAEAAARRDHALTALAVLAHAESVHDLLRGCYEAGSDLDELQRLTGYSRARLRQELVAAGVIIRRPGANTATGKANRARLVDVEVAARIGTDDVHGWLAARQADGTPLIELATRTGRSTAWVRARLRRTTTTASRAGERGSRTSVDVRCRSQQSRTDALGSATEPFARDAVS